MNLNTKNKKIYPYKVKSGAFKLMSNVLKFPEQVDNRMDGKACRITVTSYTIKDNLKSAYHEQYKNERLYQIKVIDIADKEFLVLESFLNPLPEVIVTSE